MEECRRCRRRHPERELVDLWAGRHYWPRPEDEWVLWPEQHAVRLCLPCAEAIWPALRDAVGLCSPAVAHPATALAALRLACEDLRGPGVPVDDLIADSLREAEVSTRNGTPGA